MTRSHPLPFIAILLACIDAFILFQTGRAQPPPPVPGQAEFAYLAQSGDTLEAVARRFGVQQDEIRSQEPLPAAGLLTPGQVLRLPVSESFAEPLHWVPDAAVVYGPSSAGFDVQGYLRRAGGSLQRRQEYLASTGLTPAAQVIQRVALENSVNPRLLLALLEWECRCVLGKDAPAPQDGYWLGITDYRYRWLYGQLTWAAEQLSKGYYGWRAGSFNSVLLSDDIIIRLSPSDNAGSAALQSYFAQQQSARAGQARTRDSQESWLEDLERFLSLYRQMFGDPWQAEHDYGDLLPGDLQQPLLILPFEPGQQWSFSSGPHPAWQALSALAALDFAPASLTSGCSTSQAWVVAAADGLVVRQGPGYVVQELDLPGEPADGWESTGWSLLYLHLEDQDRVQVGRYLRTGERLGRPSCSGGPATGTHLHFARKYNGEWMDAAGPLPFWLSGWVAHAGDRPYTGTLTHRDRTVNAHPNGSAATTLQRSQDDPPIIIRLPVIFHAVHQ